MTQGSLLRPLSATEKKELERVVTDWQGHLSEEVAGYLAERAIPATSALGHRLGVVGGDVPPEYRRYMGMLAIPYLDRYGSPLTLRFRKLRGDGPKYLSMPDDPSRMYNIKALFDAGDDISVCEGELDAVVLNSIGLPAVAIPGANNMKSHHRRMLAGFSRIHVWGDPDEAGVEFNRTVCKALRQARVVKLRDGDVTDTIVAEGADALKALIAKEAA